MVDGDEEPHTGRSLSIASIMTSNQGIDDKVRNKAASPNRKLQRNGTASNLDDGILALQSTSAHFMMLAVANLYGNIIDASKQPPSSPSKPAGSADTKAAILASQREALAKRNAQTNAVRRNHTQCQLYYASAAYSSCHRSLQRQLRHHHSPRQHDTPW